MLPARATCLICGSRPLQPFLTLSETGMYHGAAEHNFTHAYHLLVRCAACGHAQLEIYSHDCFHYHGDEDWDMYWWYALCPDDVVRLQALMLSCPDHSNARCDCALHRSLRESASRLWGGVKHSITPAGKVGFRWLLLNERSDTVTLKVDEPAGIGQAV